MQDDRHHDCHTNTKAAAAPTLLALTILAIIGYITLLYKPLIWLSIGLLVISVMTIIQPQCHDTLNQFSQTKDSIASGDLPSTKADHPRFTQEICEKWKVMQPPYG